jgi:hypothetical protein
VNTRDVVALYLIQAGRHPVEIKGERIVLEPGDAMLCDGSATGGYEILEPLHLKTLIIPRKEPAPGSLLRRPAVDAGRTAI